MVIQLQQYRDSMQVSSSTRYGDRRQSQTPSSRSMEMKFSFIYFFYLWSAQRSAAFHPAPLNASSSRTSFRQSLWPTPKRHPIKTSQESTVIGRRIRYWMLLHTSHPPPPPPPLCGQVVSDVKEFYIAPRCTPLGWNCPSLYFLVEGRNKLKQDGKNRLIIDGAKNGGGGDFPCEGLKEERLKCFIPSVLFLKERKMFYQLRIRFFFSPLVPPLPEIKTCNIGEPFFIGVSLARPFFTSK